MDLKKLEGRVETNLTVAVLLGTSREKRLSIHAAHYVADIGRKQPGVEVVFVDPREFSFPSDGDSPEVKDSRYTEITARADAFVIVTPEYNHGYPGSLKRMFDSEFDNYRHKPVSLVGVSNGSWGGVRACEALLHVCHTAWMINIKPELYFPRIQDIFEESGEMKQAFREQYDKNTQKVYDELIWMAKLFKAAR